MSEMNYYESLTPEQKQAWDADAKHQWDVEFPEQLQYHQYLAEQEWTIQSKVWSWIGGREWQHGFLGWSPYTLRPPERACRRIVRLSLPEHGQLRVIEKFVPYHKYWRDSCAEVEKHAYQGKCYCQDEPTVSPSVYTYYKHPNFVQTPEDPKLRDERFYLGIHAALMATAEEDGLLHHYRGTLKVTPVYEMNASAVVFNFGTPQVVADRVASIFHLTFCNEENLFALLDGADRCAICRKPLRDEVSKLVAVGPDCAKRYGIPHNLEAASKRLELRKKLLAGQS